MAPAIDKAVKMLDPIKSDPFIPHHIRDMVSELIATRFETYLEISREIIDDYQERLALCKHEPYKGSADTAAMHNKMNKMFYDRGCGISQIQEEVHEIRRGDPAILRVVRPSLRNRPETTSRFS